MLYQRVPRLFALLALGRGDGRYAKLMRQLGRIDLLILDDWGPEPLLPEQQRDLLEIVEDRYNAGSLIITCQLPSTDGTSSWAILLWPIRSSIESFITPIASS